MALHPQARALLDQVHDAGLPPLNELEPDAARVQAATLIEFVGPGPELPSVEDFTIPTSAGSIRARRYAAEDAGRDGAVDPRRRLGHLRPRKP